MGIGDWGLGIGDWGLAPSPIPNPQSPIPNPPLTRLKSFFHIIKFKIILPIKIKLKKKAYYCHIIK